MGDKVTNDILGKRYKACKNKEMLDAGSSVWGTRWPHHFAQNYRGCNVENKARLVCDEDPARGRAGAGCGQLAWLYRVLEQPEEWAQA